MATTTTISKTQFGVWYLAATVPDAATESLFELDVGGTGGESTFSPDLRLKVDPIHFQDGGKYRSIVKLMMQYQGQEPGSTAWGMGTGWLIADDLLVTAGHCVYDWGSSMGAVVTVKAFIGYSGKASSGNPSVQLRMGKQIITTAGWLQTEGNERKSDVAFIKLDRPFTGVLNTFAYEDTPVRGNATLGVVGYPGDKVRNDEKGAEMYEQFLPSNYDLEKSKRRMLEYKISTYAGQSGSPVLRVTGNKLISIGAHVYGGGLLNSASTIAGAFGNDYDAMRASFTRVGTKVNNLHGVDIFEAPPSDEPTEGFMDLFHNIGRVVLPVASSALSAASPFLGPIGPIAAIGGVALGAVGNMCESSFDASTGDIVPTTAPPRSFDGCAQRAVLCEAALQTVQKLNPDSDEAAKILSHMEATYRTLEPNLKLAPKLRYALAGPSLRMAIDDLTKPRSAESTIEVRRQLSGVNGTESFVDSDQKAFAEALISSPTIVLRDEEGFFDNLGSLIMKGATFATPLLKAGAKFGLSKLVEAVSGSAESAFDPLPTNNDPVAETLFKRAIMGEAALQAITKFPPKTLESLPLYDRNDQLSSEGFFDSFKGIVQDIGRKVMATAPSVISAVAPIAMNLLQNAAKPQGATSIPKTAQGGPSQTRGGGRTLAPPSGVPKTRSSSRYRKSTGATTESMSTIMPLQVSALSTSGDVLAVNQLVSERPSRRLRRNSTDSNEDGIFFQDF